MFNGPRANVVGVAESGSKWLILISVGRAMLCPYNVHIFVQPQSGKLAKQKAGEEKSI
jgi:hypothetical protein